jgi:hypothetical protein
LFWACASSVLHAALVFSLVSWRGGPAAMAHAPSLWMSAVEVAPPAPEPPPEPAQPERAKVQPRRAPRAPAPVAAASAEPPGGSQGLRVDDAERGTAFASGDGGLAVGEGSATGRTGSGSGDGDGSGSGAAAAAGEPERARRPAELSLWMDVDALNSRALVRPGLGFLMAVPGLRDALRGSGIRPFIDLRRARVRLAGRAADGLALAGTHAGGEQALRAAAERVAAMRGRELDWRGDADLRASSWVDGSGVDRALALHADAFVIAERKALPALLERQPPAERVRALSQLRERALLALAVEDAGVYLPGLRPCQLDALRLSIAASGDGYRLALTAHYRRPSAASGARRCLRELPSSPDQVATLVGWLALAESEPGGHGTSLKIGVTGDDIEHLLNGLAWALRPQ